MKKVLLASTALVAFAGAAAAQSVIQGVSGRSGTISIRGDAEMGIIAGRSKIDYSAAGVADTEVTVPTQFFNDVDLRFILRGETSGGVQFGAQVDLDEAGNLGRELDNQGTEVFVSGAFGRVILGDTDGAVDFVITDMGGLGQPGSIADDETSHLGYMASWGDSQFGDNQILRYDNTFGNFTVAFSIEQYAPDATGAVPDPDGTVGAADFDGMSWAIGGNTSFDFAGGTVGVALGYQHFDNPGCGPGAAAAAISGDACLPFGPAGGTPVQSGPIYDAGTVLTDGIGDGSLIGFGANVTLDSGFQAGLTYGRWQFENLRDDITHIGLGASYSFDAFSVGFNYGQWEWGDVSARGYGLSAGYDLGGGASVLFGYGNSSTDDFDFAGDADGAADDFTASSWSLGLSLAF